MKNNEKVEQTNKSFLVVVVVVVVMMIEPTCFSGNQQRNKFEMMRYLS